MVADVSDRMCWAGLLYIKCHKPGHAQEPYTTYSIRMLEHVLERRRAPATQRG